jgi:hypothetical protein
MHRSRKQVPGGRAFGKKKLPACSEFKVGHQRRDRRGCAPPFAQLLHCTNMVHRINECPLRRHAANLYTFV